MKVLRVAALVISALLPIAAEITPASAAAVVEMFDWTLTGGAVSPFAAGVSGQGTLTATQSTTIPGAWTVTAISGTLGGFDVTGLQTNSGHPGDNLIFPGTSALADDFGVAITLGGTSPLFPGLNQTFAIIFEDEPNVYEVETNNTIGTDTFTLTAAVPEPSTWVMMILGFVGIGKMTYRRRKSAMLAA
jgi:hypothetical protein